MCMKPQKLLKKGQEKLFVPNRRRERLCAGNDFHRDRFLRSNRHVAQVTGDGAARFGAVGVRSLLSSLAVWESGGNKGNIFRQLSRENDPQTESGFSPSLHTY